MTAGPSQPRDAGGIKSPVMVGAAAQSGGLTQTALRRVLTALCVTEITSWGVLYYAFPVLATKISTTTGWSMPAITAGFSAGQLTAALTGIPVGRWLDRHGPRGLMTAGSVLAMPALVAVATAQNLAWFVAAWVLASPHSSTTRRNACTTPS